MKNFTRLTLATSASPNDSQLLGAVMLGKVVLHAAELTLEVSDIDELDRAALAGRYDISKVSCAIYSRIERDYELLETGAALADRQGPLVVTRAGLTRADLRNARILAPVASTTAAQLFKRWAPHGAALVHRCSDEIVPALASGEFDAAVIDHEGQLARDGSGLEVMVNLGEWWRADTGLPVPLGCYVIRRRLHDRFSEHVEQLMRCALRVAEKGDVDVADYVRAHADSMDDDVIREHLALYINNFTRSLGHRGRQAIHALREVKVAAA
jgi:1,4-dihydroxy-6-naphthoate synthase